MPPPKAPPVDELLSIGNINEIDADWVNYEIDFYQSIANEHREIVQNDPTYSKILKPKLVEKHSIAGTRAQETARLIRILYRIAKTNSDTKQLCEEMVANFSSSLQTPETYASKLKMQKESQKTIAKPKTAINTNAEITLIPKTNFEADLKKVTQKLKTQQIVSTRKSRTGNIVLKCEKQEDIQKIEDSLKTTDFVEVKTMQKNLPRMTMLDVGEVESKEELKDVIMEKNPHISSLINNSKSFEILFLKKFNGVTNAVLKVDPEIRELIKKDNSRVFVQLKNCKVIDSYPFRICYNCQKTCSHLSQQCPLKGTTKICRYCSRNHETKDCNVKDDKSKHTCVNCENSQNERFKEKAKSHFSNSNDCPIIISIRENIIANTLYAVDTKNV